MLACQNIRRTSHDNDSLPRPVLLCWRSLCCRLARAAAVATAAAGGEPPRRRNAAKDASGNVVQVRLRVQAVSKEAEANWKEALAAFEAAEKAGWNAGQAASRSSETFDARQQGAGREVRRSHLHVGPRARPLRQDRRRAQALQPGARDRPEAVRRTRRRRASTHFKKGSDDQAFATFERAVRDDARCTEGYVNLAMMQMARSGARARRRSTTCVARSLSMRSTCRRSTRWRCLFLGRAKDNTKMLDLAAVVCRQAQLINANYAPIYNTWGLINVQQGERLRRAPHVREGACSSIPTIFEAHMNFGQITLSFRGYEDATKAFQKAVELKPKSYDAHVGLGAALRGLGDAEGAKEQYEEAKGLDGHASRGLLQPRHPLSGLHVGLRGRHEAGAQLLRPVRAARAGNAGAQAGGRRHRASCENDDAKKKRKSSKTCRPGRRQNIQLAIEAMAAMAEMEKQAAGATPPAQ